MNRNRRKGSDSDAISVVSSRSMVGKKAVADASQWPAERAPSPPKKFGSSKASSIRSYRVDDDDEKEVVPRLDHRLSSGAADSPRSRKSTPRGGYNALYSDINPYTALRIAGTPRGSSDQGIRIADNHLDRQTSTSGNDDINADPYVALKIAGNSRDDFGDEIIYDSNGSSGSEEDADDSDDSNYEHVEGEDLVEMAGDSGSEEVDDEYTNNARVSVAGSESGQGKDGGYTPGYARVSVAGSDYGKNAGRGYARVSVAGSEPDHARGRDEDFQGYAKLSVPAVDIDYGKDANYVGSRAGNQVDHEKDSYPRVSIAGSDSYHHGQDVYARLSVAGSAADQTTGLERESTGYARIYVSGSEAEYGNDFDRDVSGHERLVVVENEVDHVAEGQLSEKEGQMAGSDAQDKDQEQWEAECAAYVELSPEVQAKLQYRVRAVLISPRFELKKRTLSAFFDLYRSKFGVEPGFSSVASLCRAMPSVIQSKQSKDNDEELIIVDSSKNRRAVSGIRSGLRRIVYDVLKSVQEELTCSAFEEKCSELLGNPLGEVLSEHGYDTPTVESLVQDMPDVACLMEAVLESRVYLCPLAEDPALTDGLLVRSMTVVKGIAPKGVNTEVEDAGEVAKESAQRGSLKIGSSVTLRSLRNGLRGPEEFTPTSVSSSEEEFLQVRLRMRILLAFYNSGHGVEATEFQELYAKTFGQSFNLQELGFNSITELARHWQDIFLLQEPRPGWVFLVPSQANRRILNTLRTGLRSSVFSVLVETYPEGLDPLDFLHRLQEGMSGELWEVLEATGYICADVEKTDSILSSSSSSDFQLVDFEEICVLLDDMMDFVRLGSNEDGSVVVKLKNGEVPLVDLLDCKLNETDMGSFDELFVNLMMIAVDDTETSDADDGSSGNDGFISVGHVQSLVKSFEGSSGGLRSAHSQATDSLRLKHELRLILGCPEYSESGLALNELSNVYRDRTGQELGSKSKAKSLLRGMPDIVSKDSLVGDSVHLCKTPKNLRILSTTRAGLRQVLFWALVKNPGGVWANLLEGWFTDFSGVSLSATLQMHGYETSKNKPFYPVHVFLRDMNDLLLKKSAPLEIYTWAGDVKDPVHSDASLLGLSELLIQYDPLRFKVEKWAAKLGEDIVVDKSDLKKEEGRRESEMVEEIAERSVLKEDEGHRETESVNDAVLENSSLKEGKGNTRADWEEEIAVNKLAEEDDSDRESKLDYQHKDESSVDQERREEMQRMEFESGLELSNGEMEGPVEEQKRVVERKEDFGKSSSDVSINKDTDNEQQPDVDVVEDGPVSGENEEAAEEAESHIAQIGGNQLRYNAEAYAQLRVEATEEDESHLRQSEGDHLRSNAEAYAQLRVEATEEDESHLRQSEGDHLRSNAEAYAQLRVEATEEDESHLGQNEGDQLSRSNAEAYAQLRVAGKGPKVNLDEWQFTDSEDDEEVGESEEEEEEEEEEEDDGGVERERENSEPANSNNAPEQTMPKVSSAGPKVKVAGKDASRAWILPNKGAPWK